ncbi:MAG: hypothetical protein IPM69_09220 [Ignavibacteria bacterium]|nr:hypothetical protein [Ignavibacteria bacterium]
MKNFILQLLFVFLFSIAITNAQTQSICSGSPFATTISVEECNCIDLLTNNDYFVEGSEYDDPQIVGAQLAPGTVLTKVKNGNTFTITGRVLSSTCSNFSIIITEYCKFRHKTDGTTYTIQCRVFWSQPIYVTPNITQNNISLNGINSVLNCTRTLTYSVGSIPYCYDDFNSDLNCEWTLPSGWTGIPTGPNNRNINVTTSECTGGTVSVHITATTPCPINIIKQITVTRTPLTEGVVEIFGDRCLCNVTGGSFNLPEWVCGTITWSGPQGWTITPSTNGKSCTVVMPDGVGVTGELCATIVSCGTTLTKCATLKGKQALPTITSIDIDYGDFGDGSPIWEVLCPERRADIVVHTSSNGDMDCISYEVELPSELTHVSTWSTPSNNIGHLYVEQPSPQFTGFHCYNYRVRVVDKCGNHGDWFDSPYPICCKGYDQYPCSTLGQ